MGFGGDDGMCVCACALWQALGHKGHQDDLATKNTKSTEASLSASRQTTGHKGHQDDVATKNTKNTKGFGTRGFVEGSGQETS